MVATTVAEPLPEYWIAEIDESGNLIAHYHGEHPMRPCKLFDTEAELKAAYPQIEEAAQRQTINAQKLDIDRNAGVDISKAHLAKAREAEHVLFDKVTAPERLPHLYPEAVDKGITLKEMAKIVWDKHTADAAMDNQRIKDKAQV